MFEIVKAAGGARGGRGLPTEEGHCHPTGPLEGRGVEAVLCSGVGRRAVAALGEAGIRVLLTQAQRVDEACGGHHGEGGGHCHP